MKSLERKAECFHIFRKIGRNIVYGNLTNLLLENLVLSCLESNFQRISALNVDMHSRKENYAAFSSQPSYNC